MITPTLGETVLQRLEAIVNEFNSHTHVPPGAVTGGGGTAEGATQAGESAQEEDREE